MLPDTGAARRRDRNVRHPNAAAGPAPRRTPGQPRAPQGAGPLAGVGQVGGDPLEAGLSARLRVQPDSDVEKWLFACRHTGFGHRHLGDERRGRLAQVPGECTGHRRQHRDGDRGSVQLRAVPQQRPQRSRARGPGIGGQRRPRSERRRSRPARVSRTSSRWARAARTPRQGRNPATPRPPRAPAPPGRTASRPAPARRPSASACAACMTATVPGPVPPGMSCTGEKRCRRHGARRTSSGSSRSRHTASRQPFQLSSSSWWRTTGRARRGRHPVRVGQRRSILDAERQGVDTPAQTANRIDRMLEIRWFTVEYVEHELVAGDLGRHPVELCVDRCHPGRHAPVHSHLASLGNTHSRRLIHRCGILGMAGGGRDSYYSNMRSSSREEIVEVLDALRAAHKRARDLTFDVLTTPNGSPCWKTLNRCGADSPQSSTP